MIMIYAQEKRWNFQSEYRSCTGRAIITEHSRPRTTKKKKKQTKTYRMQSINQSLATNTYNVVHGLLHTTIRDDLLIIPRREYM